MSEITKEKRRAANRDRRIYRGRVTDVEKRYIRRSVTQTFGQLRIGRPELSFRKDVHVITARESMLNLLRCPHQGMMLCRLVFPHMAGDDLLGGTCRRKC